jgi:hypothetical protein
MIFKNKNLKRPRHLWKNEYKDYFVEQRRRWDSRRREEK